MRDGWVETTLGEAATLRNTKVDPSTVNPDDPYVGLEHLDSGDSRIRGAGRAGEVSSLVSPFQMGDTLFGRLRPYLRKVVLADFAGVCTSELLVLNPVTEQVLPAFLHLLASSDGTIETCIAQSAGSRMPRTSAADLLAVRVALPPLAEQRRIVDLIAAVDENIAVADMQAGASKTLRHVVREDLMARAGSSARHVAMGDLLQIDRGSSPRPIDNFITSDGSGEYWIRIGDAPVGSKYITSATDRITLKGFPTPRFVYPGDFILSNSMSFGRPFILRIKGCIHDGWLRLAGVGERLDEDYLYNFLQTTLIQAEFESRAAGSGVRNLKIDSVRSVLIPVPEIEEQRKIGATMNDLDAMVGCSIAIAESLRSLRSALLADLLSGSHEIPESYDTLPEAS